MRLNLKGNLGYLNLSQNAGMIIETFCLLSLSNEAGKHALFAFFNSY